MRISNNLRSLFSQPKISPSNVRSQQPAATGAAFFKDSFDAQPLRAPSLAAPQATANAQSAQTQALQEMLMQLLSAVIARLLGGGAAPAPAPAGSTDSVTPVASQPAPSVSKPTGPQAGDPSTWTDDNAPYGVTLAGFSPQNHTDITPEALRSTDPASVSKHAKYLVYNYFLANKTPATHDWAPKAAADLNRMYATNLFHPIDGETLGYGDEYVHTAPNGHGMLPGTYNPNANGELLWGSFSDR